MSLIDGLKGRTLYAIFVSELRTQYENLMQKQSKVKGDDKLAAMRSIWAGLRDVEKAGASDNAFSLAEIQELRKLLPEVEAAISRCEAGKKRREENAEERAQYE